MAFSIPLIILFQQMRKEPAARSFGFFSYIRVHYFKEFSISVMVILYLFLLLL